MVQDSRYESKPVRCHFILFNNIRGYALNGLLFTSFISLPNLREQNNPMNTETIKPLK